MKEIHFASSNPEKILEVGQILADCGIAVIPIETELNEIRSEDQAEIALQKAITAYSAIKKPVIAEDTGVYFGAYENFPGVFPSFVFKAIGYGGILRLLEGKKRDAYFKTIVAYFDGKNGKVFEGVCKGNIAQKPDSLKYQSPKLPYEAIFIPEGKRERLSRMGKAEKNSFSHRANAVRKFAVWYSKIK
ncbi:MAG: non-canonical purine NTP pyrophosphatase [Candidatus Micrarchaeota archaeon]